MEILGSRKFSDAYTLASDIWRFLFESSDKEVKRLFRVVFLPCCRKQSEIFSKPQRWTVLHHFIYIYLETSHDEFERHRDDMRALVIQEYKTILDYYRVTYPRFVIPSESSGNYEAVTEEIISVLRDLIPYKRIAHDTFHLLFEDREFLLRFNQGVAQVIQLCVQKGMLKDFTQDGILKRVNIPQWVKRAVLYRDKGRCVYCGKDLTGTIARGEEVHYDHIVPLARGGINDPTNLQLMCRECNLKKARSISTSDMYQLYWHLDDEKAHSVISSC